MRSSVSILRGTGQNFRRGWEGKKNCSIVVSLRRIHEHLGKSSSGSGANSLGVWLKPSSRTSVEKYAKDRTKENSRSWIALSQRVRSVSLFFPPLFSLFQRLVRRRKRPSIYFEIIYATPISPSSGQVWKFDRRYRGKVINVSPLEPASGFHSSETIRSSILCIRSPNCHKFPLATLYFGTNFRVNIVKRFGIG